MAFIRRFVIPPATFLDIEAINILEVEPPSAISGVSVGTVGLVAEWAKGPFNTPVLVTSGQDIKDVFGTFSKYISAHGSGFDSIKGKRFGALVLIRPDLTLGNVTFTLNAAQSVDVKIPAGTGLSNGSTFIVATAQDLTIPAGQTTGTVAVFGASATTGTATGGQVTTILDAPTLPTGATLTVTNAATLTAKTSSQVDSAYGTAIDATNTQDGNGSLINIICAARGSATVNSSLKTNAVNFSLGGPRGRIAVVQSAPGTSKSTVVTDAVALGSTDRVIYAWPFVKSFVPEAGATLTVPPAPWIAAVLSQIGPEQNPGQVTPFLAGISGLEDGLGTLSIDDYIQFRANGIAAFRNDRADGFVIQSGIMLNKTNVSRRRMVDFIGESEAVALGRFNKKLSIKNNRRLLTGEIVNFLTTLLSPNNPAQQKIDAFLVDPDSGNTPTTLGQGQYVVIEKIRLLSSLDEIMLQIEAGEQVVISEAA